MVLRVHRVYVGQCERYVMCRERGIKVELVEVKARV